VSRVLSLLPSHRPPRTPSRSVAQMSPTRGTRALRWHSWRARDSSKSFSETSRTTLVLSEDQRFSQRPSEAF